MWLAVSPRPSPQTPAEVFNAARVASVQGVQGRVPARGAVRLRALLRAARGRLRPRRPARPGELRRRIQAGRRTSGATPTSCRSQAARPAGWPRASAAGGLHAADPRRPPRRAARPARGVGQERRRQPDALVQGPRRLGRRWPAPASSASRRSRAPRPATSPTPSPPHAAALGLPSYVFIPADLEEQKMLATGVYGTNLVAVRRQLRRRQPPLHRAVGRARAGRS